MKPTQKAGRPNKTTGERRPRPQGSGERNQRPAGTGGRNATARDIALDILTRIDEQQSYSNLELKGALERTHLAGPDVGLVTELVYGTIQRRNTLDHVIGKFIKGGPKKLQPWVLNLIRMSLYQIRYLDRVPERAAVHEAVEIAKRRGHQGISSLVNGVLRNVLRTADVWEVPEDDEAARISLEESHPAWLVKRWIRLYGAETARAICQSNNKPPMPTIRVNRLRNTREMLLRDLEDQFPEAEPSRVTPDAILLHSGHAAGSIQFRQGLCTIQDESSMLVAPALHVEPGLRVLDACAAPGGKTTHIAELMNNEGEIIACDVHPHKRELIKETANRLGITIIDTLVSDASELPEKGLGTFDRILLDAPCTGFGVIRRKPDLKWNKSKADITEISYVQYRLLEQVSQMLKPGGYLVYSTCTIEPEENQEIVERFVKEHPEFVLDNTLADDMPEAVSAIMDRDRGYVQILPHHFDSDGFFIARLKRIES
ncbi:16S rRNA (cytosine(967)-C(5))-methyltransferase RsmB [Brevibacillus dissolubilis]|uniref:16S rRNA (cytosine(967)-C(5))-methyltransferase RsmB n=1 Tax=Brevibacillus dissolubilis TaxID=1844116 RepID=UPI002100030B|nr:16S rRNA (cytosine(967)-C(5))-methyltransferase RsmB [Brevibacillus dissolubilis]